MEIVLAYIAVTLISTLSKEMMPMGKKTISSLSKIVATVVSFATYFCSTINHCNISVVATLNILYREV